MAECRICFEEEEEGNKLMHPCPCKGTQKWIHELCLRRWYLMNEQNKYCSVCKYRFTVKRGPEYYEIPPNIKIFMENLRMHGLIGAFQNLYIAAAIFVFLFDPRTFLIDLYIAHGIYQIACIFIYAALFYKKHIHKIRNKALYWSFIDSDTRWILYFHIIAPCLLFVLTNPIYHLGCVIFIQYTYNPLQYYHYIALKELNQLAPVYFIEYKEKQ